MDEETTYAWVDILTLVAQGLVLILVMVIAMVSQTKTEDVANCLGASVMVEIRWPDGEASDVDLWVLAPNDHPVGYSNLRGAVMNLMRDDLGVTSDLGSLNYEMACSRGIPAGNWTINLHLYTQRSPVVPVDVKISGRASGHKFTIERAVQLVRAGQELTVVRFETDSTGALIEGSEFDAYRAVRAAGSP